MPLFLLIFSLALGINWTDLLLHKKPPACNSHNIQVQHCGNSHDHYLMSTWLPHVTWDHVSKLVVDVNHDGEPLIKNLSKHTSSCSTFAHSFIPGTIVQLSAMTAHNWILILQNPCSFYIFVCSNQGHFSPLLKYGTRPTADNCNEWTQACNTMSASTKCHCATNISHLQNKLHI